LAIELKTESVLFVIIYRPPKHSPIFIQEFSELLSLCVTRYDKIVLNGDLNIHVNKKADPRTIELLNLLDSFDLTQHNRSNRPARTHIRSRYNTWTNTQ